MIKMTCGFCGEEMKMEHGAIHECETDVDETIKKNRESAIYATGYWNGIAYKRMRELTDEEIGQFKGQWYRGDFNSFYDLVKAILKKASEK